MADEPENLILHLLREMRDETSEIRKELAEFRDRFSYIDKRLDEVHETMYTVAGLAAHSNVRHDKVNYEIEDLKRRVSKLEENT